MAKLGIGRASEVVADGALRVVPGFGNTTSDRTTMSTPPFFIDSGFVNIATDPVIVHVPIAFDATVKAILLHVMDGLATDDGTAVLTVGTVVASGAILVAYNLTTGATATTNRVIDLSSTTNFVGTSLTKGDAVRFSFGTASTATGRVAVSLVCIPRI